LSIPGERRLIPNLSESVHTAKIDKKKSLPIPVGGKDFPKIWEGKKAEKCNMGLTPTPMAAVVTHNEPYPYGAEGKEGEPHLEYLVSY